MINSAWPVQLLRIIYVWDNRGDQLILNIDANVPAREADLLYQPHCESTAQDSRPLIEKECVGVVRAHIPQSLGAVADIPRRQVQQDTSMWTLDGREIQALSVEGSWLRTDGVHTSGGNHRSLSFAWRLPRTDIAKLQRQGPSVRVQLPYVGGFPEGVPVTVLILDGSHKLKGIDWTDGPRPTAVLNEMGITWYYRSSFAPVDAKGTDLSVASKGKRRLIGSGILFGISGGFVVAVYQAGFDVALAFRSRHRRATPPRR